jgi:hypothetical protein
MERLRAAGKQVLFADCNSRPDIFTGKNERRCIMRHALGFYRTLIIAGLYTQQPGDRSFHPTSIESYFPALKSCIAAHPILSAAIKGESSEAPEFVRPATLDMRNHIEISEGDVATDELDLLKQVMRKTHDQLFVDVDKIPPWKVIVLPLSSRAKTRRLYILLAYSHSHGDGKSGLAFHRAFLRSLETPHQNYENGPIYQTTASPLPPPVEEACNLRISWSYLLAPFLGAYLLKFISHWLNVQASTAPQVAGTWVGKPTRYDPDDFRTGLEFVVLDKEYVDGILTACKAHGAKFTGLLHEVIVRALSKVLPADTPARNFVGQTALDPRHLIPRYSNDDMIICVSAAHGIFGRTDCASDNDTDNTMKDDEALWNAACRTTTQLAERASTLADQPMGLLHYLNHFRMWLINELGKDRNTSYAISNLLSFDPWAHRDTATPSQPKKTWDIERMVFSQPASATGDPVSVQVVTRKDGAMVITLTWQLGVLGVADEDGFIRDVANGMKDSLTDIASSGKSTAQGLSRRSAEVRT